MWGTKLTTKADILQEGDSAEIAAGLKSIIVFLVVVVPASPLPVRFSNFS